MSILVLALAVSTSTVLAQENEISKEDTEVYNLFDDSGNANISADLKAENDQTLKESNTEDPRPSDANANDINSNIAENSNAAVNSNANSNISNANANVNNANANNQAEEEVEEKPSRFPHPVSANAWRTQEFMLTAKLPKRAALEECRKENIAVGKEATNADVMVASIEAVNGSIQANPELYHYCFYYAMMNLDLTLENDALNRSYARKYGFFMDRMKALWVLGRALDFHFGTKKYFGYLRQRFIGLSRDHFGRHLEVLSPPLGDRGRSLPLLDPKAAIPYYQDF